MAYLFRDEPIGIYQSLKKRGMLCAGGERWGLEVDPRGGGKKIPRESAFALDKGETAPPDHLMFACRLYVFHEQPLVKTARYGKSAPYDICPRIGDDRFVVRFKEEVLGAYQRYPDGCWVSGHASYYVFPELKERSQVVAPEGLEYFSWSGWKPF